jgi:hypothetical protein
MECKKCETIISEQRYQLGYTECLDCSEVEPYSAHTVYPHKTGGYVQPVSKTTSNNLKRMDRRSTGKARVGKSSGDWDKWLEQYYHDLYNPKPERKVVEDICTIAHMNESTLYNKTMLYYKENGYQQTISWLKELFNNDKISLGSKSKMLDEINHLEVMPSRLRKFAMKIN